MKKTIYSDEHKSLIQRLKKARQEAGLTQINVGELLGKDQTFVSKVESGQYRIDAIQLSKFAKIYKKNISYFIK